MKVLVTGADGQLGYQIKKVFKNHELVLTDKINMDITDIDSVISFLLEEKPKAIIHGAAYTNVDLAELEPEIAYKVNAQGTRNICVASEKVGAKLVYISTDYVFDGEKNSHYQEIDRTNPQSIYGKSKLAGELFVQSLTNKFFIMRTSWLYGENGKNFVDAILKKAETGDELKVVNDQFGSPTYTKDLAEVILQLIETEKYGIYHASGEGKITWYDFAKEILKLKNYKNHICPISTEEIGRPAPRPKYSVLDNLNLRIENIFMPSWKESLRQFLTK